MRSAVLAAAAVLVLAAAPAAGARSFVLRASGSTTGPGVVQAIGDFRPPSGASVRRAVRALGEPTFRRGGGEICNIR